MSAFRGIRDGDQPELERMVLALHEEDPCAEKMSAEKIRGTVAELAAHPDKGTIVIFAEEGAVAGYAIVIYRWSNEYGGDIALVDELYVKPPWRGKGVASAFLDHVPGLRPGRIKGIQLEVHPGNGRALALYRSLGFAAADNLWLFRNTDGRGT